MTLTPTARKTVAFPKPGKRKKYKVRRAKWKSALMDSAAERMEDLKLDDPEGQAYCEECARRGKRTILILLRWHNVRHLPGTGGMGRVRSTRKEDIELSCYACHTAEHNAGKRPGGADWMDR